MIRIRHACGLVLFAAVGLVGWLMSAGPAPETLVAAPVVGFASFGIGAQLFIFGRTNVYQLVFGRKS